MGMLGNKQGDPVQVKQMDLAEISHGTFEKGMLSDKYTHTNIYTRCDSLLDKHNLRKND